MKKNNEIMRLVDQLNEISFGKMADALEDLFQSKDFDSLDRVSFLDRIISPEYESRIDKKIAGRIERAGLKGCPEVIDNCKDSSERNYLPTGINDTLASMDFIRNGMNVCILGPSDSGKTYLAKALAVQACNEYRVSYHHFEPFLESLVALKEKGYEKYQKKVQYYIRMDLLVLDDFLLHTITDEREIKVLFEVMEKRNELSKSTIVCSQREPGSWPSMILNDTVSSNAIMKRATKHYTVVIQSKS